MAVTEVDPNIIIPAIIVGLTSTAATLFAYLGNRNAKKASKHSAEINDAVNNRHDGSPKLYDLALSNQASIRKTHRRIDEVNNRLNEAIEAGREERYAIREELRNHVEWEMGMVTGGHRPKYGDGSYDPDAE